MQTIDELNGVYSYKDAVKVVENILHETKQERDSYGPVEGTGLYNNWDAYYRIQERVGVIEDILTALARFKVLFVIARNPDFAAPYGEATRCYLYRKGIQENDLGFASAVGVVLLVLVLAINLTQLTATGTFKKESTR